MFARVAWEVTRAIRVWLSIHRKALVGGGEETKNRSAAGFSAGKRQGFSQQALCLRCGAPGAPRHLQALVQWQFCCTHAISSKTPA